MFTGIITAQGQITAIKGSRLHIVTDLAKKDREIGASVSHNGCCLTIVADHRDGYDVEVSDTTREITTLGTWQVGRRINLEPALRVGDALGGHLVQGHVDTVAKLHNRKAGQDAEHLWFAVDRGHAGEVIARGSVTVDGASLTINEVKDEPLACLFRVTIVPHTAAVTTLSSLQMGDHVNIEFDVIGRYLSRWRTLQENTKP